MKTTYMTLAILALFSTSAFAGYERSDLVHFGHDQMVKARACFPATGNWVNAATQSCPDQGSGGVGFNRRVEIKCEHEAKR